VRKELSRQLTSSKDEKSFMFPRESGVFMELKKGQCGWGMVSGRESINEIREAGRTR